MDDTNIHREDAGVAVGEGKLADLNCISTQIPLQQAPVSEFSLDCMHRGMITRTRKRSADCKIKKEPWKRKGKLTTMKLSILEWLESSEISEVRACSCGI